MVGVLQSGSILVIITSMKKITSFLFGFVLIILAPSLVFASGARSTNLIKKADGTTYLGVISSASAKNSNPDYVILPRGYARNLTVLLTSVLSLLIAIIALLVFVYLIWGGIEWITSGGDKSKTDQARGKIIAALVGVIIVASSYAVLQIMLRFLGFTSLTEAFNHIKPISDGLGGNL